MIKHRMVVVAFALCAFGGFVAAESLKDKKDHAFEEKQQETDTKNINDYCGSKFTFKFDWPTWKAASDQPGHHASSSCGLGLQGIKAVCTNDLGKAAVAKQLKTVTCKGDATTRSAEYKGGALTIHTSLTADAPDISKAVQKALEDGMK